MEGVEVEEEDTGAKGFRSVSLDAPFTTRLWGGG
jgi:hypothetical protein